MKKPRHSNVAIFVPHNGCPHQCSFCNQREITGQSYQPDSADVISAAEEAKRSLGDRTRNAEIAFFGGSFTAIPRDYMLKLLSAAAPYVSSGEFSGIRISTRPDSIDREILDILEEYGVSSVELGAQSTDDNVLRLNKRGHTREDIIKAAGLIKEYGFSLGLQMMTGLYGSDDEKDVKTAQDFISLSPDTVRIYPTVVLRGTELYELYKKGEYHPKDAAGSVELCSRLLLMFEEKNINVIRLGLHDSQSLRDNMAAGAFHPAFRELCHSRILLRKAQALLKEAGTDSPRVTFAVAPASVSPFIGQKKENIKKLSQMGIEPSVIRDDTLGRYEVRLV